MKCAKLNNQLHEFFATAQSNTRNGLMGCTTKIPFIKTQLIVKLGLPEIKGCRLIQRMGMKKKIMHVGVGSLYQKLELSFCP